jgi:CheY-like chemotaxis protein
MYFMVPSQPRKDDGHARLRYCYLDFGEYSGNGYVWGGFGECVKPCILVVDDNLLNRELLGDWLDAEGCEVWFATDLKSSYDAFAKRILDAVLLDINLGKDDGLDLVGWMSRSSEMRDIPVIAHDGARDGCGARASRERRLQGLSLEADRLPIASRGA